MARTNPINFVIFVIAFSCRSPFLTVAVTDFLVPVHYAGLLQLHPHMIERLVGDAYSLLKLLLRQFGSFTLAANMNLVSNEDARKQRGRNSAGGPGPHTARHRQDLRAGPFRRLRLRSRHGALGKAFRRIDPAHCLRQYPFELREWFFMLIHGHTPSW
jgi:hypothetical protein